MTEPPSPNPAGGVGDDVIARMVDIVKGHVDELFEQLARRVTDLEEKLHNDDSTAHRKHGKLIADLRRDVDTLRSGQTLGASVPPATPSSELLALAAAVLDSPDVKAAKSPAELYKLAGEALARQPKAKEYSSELQDIAVLYVMVNESANLVRQDWTVSDKRVVASQRGARLLELVAPVMHKTVIGDTAPENAGGWFKAAIDHGLEED